jgi:hypothetical protein
MASLTMALGSAGVKTTAVVATVVGEGAVVAVGIVLVTAGVPGDWRGAAQAARTKTNITHNDNERARALRMAIAWIIKESAPIGVDPRPIFRYLHLGLGQAHASLKVPGTSLPDSLCFSRVPLLFAFRLVPKCLAPDFQHNFRKRQTQKGCQKGEGAL